ncbi:hypothetical protein LZ318_02995 [Saccharopolyspora indica]|uniref:hypothetical protein n=1 Tax=Saccharopolyspora indica TaxID=1229659 RepID=UPI0022EA1EE1|nr:hypothetical protein [Saccharopolyspora indica]MDA3649443.1 hypothetical protein [Saccharopolyspora indica]
MLDGEPRPPAGGWAERVLRMSVRDLVRTGSFDGIAVGAAKEQLREVLPEPSSWAPTDGPESDLWSYGSVDLVFCGGLLLSIFCDGLEHLGHEDPHVDRIAVDASFLRPGMTGAQLVDALRADGIAWSVRPGAVPEHTARVRTGPHGVEFLLESDPWEPADPGEMRLIGFEHRAR